MKLRIIIIFSFLFSFLFDLSAQNSYPKVRHKRETYYKYPYKIKYTSYAMTKGYDYGYNDDIMPVADSLPEGKFIVYGDFYKYRLFHLMRKRVKFDTTKVVLIFSSKNGKKNGASVWYDKQGHLRRTGSYLNDEKEGEWKTYDLSGNLTTVENYKNGLLSGDYAEYNSYGKQIVKGQYLNNKEEGTWENFFADGKIKVQLNIIPDSSIAYRKLNQMYYFKYLSYEDLGDFPHHIETLDIYGPLTTYYQNGQIMGRRNIISGYYSLNDTIYHSNGKIKELTVLLPRSNDSIHNYMYTEYDSIGRLMEEALYMDDYLKYSKKYDEKGILEEETYDYTTRKYKSFNNSDVSYYGDYVFNDYYKKYYVREIDSALLKKDTVLLLYARYKDGKPVSRRVQLLPFNIILEKNSNKNGLGFDYIVTKDKSTRQIRLQEFYYDKDSTFALVKFRHSENDTGIVVDSIRPFCNGKLFTGKVIWSLKRINRFKINNQNFDISFKLDKGVLYISSSSVYYFYATSSEYLGFLKIDPNSTSVYNISKGRVELFLKNGLPDSTLKIYDRENNLRFIERYKDAKPDGPCIKYDKYTPPRGSVYRYMMGVSSYTFYKAGMRQDTSRSYYPSGKLESMDVYKNDTLNGTSYTYSEDGLLTSMTRYLNGEKNGLCYDYNYEGKLMSVCNYKNGKLDGTSTYYDTQNSMISSVINTSNGYFDGCSYKYFSGSLEVKIQYCYDLKDSVDIYYFNDNYYNYDYDNDYEEDYTYVSEYNLHDVEVKQFYKGGENASLGRYKYYKKSGIWNYWDESGTLIKQIEYYDSTKKDHYYILNNDTVYFLGSIKEWYPNSKLKTEGYVMSEENAYECKVEGYVTRHDIYYVNYWDSKGQQIVKGGNGKLLTCHPNEQLESSTLIMNGVKDSIYKEWDPDGHLKKIGAYKKGIKEGRWLEGDLEGISYIDDQCFSTQEEFENALRGRKENLHVDEKYYVNGEVVKHNSYYNN